MAFVEDFVINDRRGLGESTTLNELARANSDLHEQLYEEQRCMGWPPRLMLQQPRTCQVASSSKKKHTCSQLPKMMLHFGIFSSKRAVCGGVNKNVIFVKENTFDKELEFE